MQIEAARSLVKSYASLARCQGPTPVADSVESGVRLNLYFYFAGLNSSYCHRNYHLVIEKAEFRFQSKFLCDRAHLSGNGCSPAILKSEIQFDACR